MHKPPQFSDLPNRIVVPVAPHRRASRAQLIVSFAIACILVAFAIILGCAL
jgi:hypothetical protein